MNKFFYPGSVVVVGVSPATENLGRNMVDNLYDFGFQGKIYAVGRDGGAIRGSGILPTVSSLPEPVDLAAILTPAATVPSVIRECGELGIRHAVILSAGFTELSDEREGLQRELAETARRYGIRFVGPNCMGLICTDSGLAVPFAAIREGALKRGSLTILAQSGSVAFLAAWIACEEGVGLAKFVSMGNKLNVDEVDLLPYFIQDEQTETICIYLEGLQRGRELVEVARRSPKPIVILKGNVSEATGHVAKSHTASLASDDRVVEGAFRQAGVTRVHSVREFATAAKALNMPPLRGNRLAGVVTSGGIAVIGADYCQRFGFELPPLPDELRADLDRRARAKVIRFGNPVDLGDVFDNNHILSAFEQVLALPAVDGVFVSLFHFHERRLPGVTTLEMIDRMAEISRQWQKPVAVSFPSETCLVRELMQQTDFPIFNDVEESIAGLRMLRERSQHLLSRPTERSVPPFPADRSRVAALLNGARRDQALSTVCAQEVLEAYGLPVASWRFARDGNEAMAAAGELGFPVALKAVADGLIHKSDAGGVLLDLTGAAAVGRGFAQLRENLALRAPGAALRGALVQRYLPGGVELILGAKRDEQFGPVVMFGVGGIFAEALGEVAFRLAPLSRSEAEAMIWQVRGAALLKGVRGNPPADVAAVVEAILRLGQLIVEQPSIREIDVNPLKAFALGQGVVAVDARLGLD